MQSVVSSHKYKSLQDRLFFDQKYVPKLIFTFLSKRRKIFMKMKSLRLFISWKILLIWKIDETCTSQNHWPSTDKLLEYELFILLLFIPNNLDKSNCNQFKSICFSLTIHNLQYRNSNKDSLTTNLIPNCVRDFQHHLTFAIEFFYRKAVVNYD